MAEEVLTGGLKRFSYDKHYDPKLNPEEKKEIEEAYKQASERRYREKRNKAIIFIFIFILLLAVGITLILL